MSITSDIRTYADTALEQGKTVLDQAQSQLNEVTGQANEFVGKLRGTAKENVSGLTAKANAAVADVRSQAEKAVNIDAVKTAIEPYLAQAKGYSTSVTDRAEELFTTVKSDKRVAKAVATVEGLTGTVVETVQDRIVKPVQSLTGIGGKPTAKVKTVPAATTPAVTKPAPKPSKVTARKAPAKRVPAKS